MGNQHSAPDKDRDKEPSKEPAKDTKDKPAGTGPVRTGSKHEKHRSRTIASAPLPPAETKVNADHSHNVPTAAPAVALPIPSTTTTTTTSSASDGRSLDPKMSIESSSATGSGTASPAKARRTSKPIPQKDVVEAIKEMHLKDLPPSTDNVPHEEEATPKFETLRVASQTSLVDEDEDADADKDGSSVIVEDLRVGPEKVPLVLDWTDGGKKVAVAGTFTGWRKRINLRRTYPTLMHGVIDVIRNGRFSTVVQVRPGTHRFHFLVDGEWRISNEFPTAVDSEGNLLNYFEASEFSDNEEIEYARSASISCTPLTSTGLTARARTGSTKGYMDKENA